MLGADTDSSLVGYGTINASIDFDGSADLLADNGTLTVNGAIDRCPLRRHQRHRRRAQRGQRLELEPSSRACNCKAAK